jgi:diacylglycerol kinase
MKNRIRSFRYAIEGIGALLKDEPNARIHLFAAVAAITGGIALHISAMEWICIAFAISAVIAMEAVTLQLKTWQIFLQQVMIDASKRLKMFLPERC